MFALSIVDGRFSYFCVSHLRGMLSSLFCMLSDNTENEACKTEILKKKITLEVVVFSYI